MKTIIIGSVAAGVSAAAKIGAVGSGQVTVYERGMFFSCGSCGLPHYLAHPEESLGEAIASKEKQLEALGIKALRRHEVQSIDAAKREITVQDLETGRVFTDQYDRLVLATGAVNATAEVPGCRKMGVHTLRRVEDVIFLREFIKTPFVRDIVVLGANIHGLEIAKAFLKRGRNVRIIEKSGRFLPDFDAEVAAQVRQKLERAGVSIHLGEAVTAFEGRTYVETVRTAQSSYPCDLCICADDLVPVSTLLASAGAALDSNGAVRINRNFETSLSGIYAAGECAGIAEGTQSTLSLHVGGLELARTGMTEEMARQSGLQVHSVTVTAHDRPGICPNPKEVTLKLVCDANGRIVGAQGWGEKNVAARINAVAVAVAAGMTAQQLANVDFVYSSAVSSLWDPIQMACTAVR